MQNKHILRAYQRARESGYTVKQIAAEIGTSPNNLSNIIARHHADDYNPRKESVYWGKLIRWLDVAGFLEAPKQIDATPPPDAAHETEPEYESAILALAQTCEDLARYLRDPQHAPEKRAQVAAKNLALLEYTAENLTQKMDS